MTSQSKLLSFIAVAAVLVIGAYAWEVLPDLFQKRSEPIKTEPAKYVPDIFPDDPVRGNPEAPKTIVVFGDYECEACVAGETLIKDILAQGDTKVVWKDCPLPNYPNAHQAAEAAFCAGDQNKYWEYHDLLMKVHDLLGNGTYSELAKIIGLDVARFTNCLDTSQKAARVDLALSECQRAAPDALPYYFVNGQAVPGSASSMEIFNLINRP